MLGSFTKKKVNSLTLGEQLKKIRGEGRVTLHEVSRETKIPVKYLVMIEESDYEKLPPDVYVKGFLKSYAEYLGVSPKKLVALYTRDKDIKRNLQNNGAPVVVPKKDRMPRFVVTPKMITATIVILVALGGFYYLYREIGRFAAVPRLVVTNPIGDTAVESDTLTISGYTEQDAKLTINDQPVAVNDNGEFREDLILQGGLNTVTVASVNRFGKTASRTLSIKSTFAKPDMNIGEAGEAGGLVSGDESNRESGVDVSVRTDSLPTWLSVESDGSLVYSGTMLPGATQEFKGEKEVRVTSGKANQTVIRVNGKAERKLADDPGIVRDVVFTPND